MPVPGDQLSKQLEAMFNEMHDLMAKLPGNIERIKDCTLKEQWRHDHCRAFNDYDSDNDDWKSTYEAFDPGGEDWLKDFIDDYMTPCGLEPFVVLIKYPAVHKQIDKLGGWK